MIDTENPSNLETTHMVPASSEKTKKLQTILSGEDYIDYVSAAARVSFGRKLTNREMDDFLMKKAISLLVERINIIRLESQTTFVEMDRL